jgi:hypothetical protein
MFLQVTYSTELSERQLDDPLSASKKLEGIMFGV